VTNFENFHHVADEEEAASPGTASPLLQDKQIARDLLKLQQSKSYSRHYEFQSVLGEGAFCTVYQAIDKETEELIAVKVIKRKILHKEGVELIKQEANLLQEMDHSNIVRFKHVSGNTVVNKKSLTVVSAPFLYRSKKSKEKSFWGWNYSEAVSFLRSSLRGSTKTGVSLTRRALRLSRPSSRLSTICTKTVSCIAT